MAPLSHMLLVTCMPNCKIMEPSVRKQWQSPEVMCLCVLFLVCNAELDTNFASQPAT